MCPSMNPGTRMSPEASTVRWPSYRPTPATGSPAMATSASGGRPLKTTGEPARPGGINRSVALVPSPPGNVPPGHGDIGFEELAREHRQDAPSPQHGVGGLAPSGAGQA